MWRRWVVGAAVGVTLVVPAGAFAGTAAVVDSTEGRGSEPVQSVAYTAAPGEANRVTARLMVSGNIGTATITDTAGIQPGRGCTRVGAIEVRCRLGDATGVRPAANAFDFVLGDRDDSAEIVASPSTSGSFDGGAGNDVLRAGDGVGGNPEDGGLPAGASIRGGPGNDLLVGGAGDDLLDESGRRSSGSDTLRGGDGTDSVTYAGRRRAVRADLSGDRDDGVRGERDAISGVENLTGGRAADRLTGDRFDNQLVGGGGSDALAGRAGDDNLHSTSEDFFPGGERTRDRIAGGPGLDYIVGTGGSNRIDTGPGPDTVEAGGGADRIRARDRASDEVRCGGGRDTAALDALDSVTRTCERIARRGAPRAVFLTQVGALGLLGDPARPYADPRISCPSDLPFACRVVVTLSRRGTPFGSGRGRLPRGSATEIFVYLNEAGRAFARRGGTVRLEVGTTVGRVRRLARYAVALDALPQP